MFNLFVVVGMLANLEFISGAGRFEIFAITNRAQVFLLLLTKLKSLCCCWQNFFFLLLRIEP